MMTMMVITDMDVMMTIKMMVAMVLMITCDVDDIDDGGHGDNNNDDDDDDDDDIKALCELFADDTSLHDHHTDLNTIRASLQNSLDNLIDWTEMNHMALHQNKTKFMLTTTRQKRQNIVSYFHPLTVQSITIEEVQKHRVLGVIIDNSLSWTPHVNSLCKKKSIKTFQLCKIKKKMLTFMHEKFLPCPYSVFN